MKRSILGLAVLVLLLCTVDPAHAGFVPSFTPYSPTPAWQSIFDGFSTQENFDSTTLAPGLSITLSGGAFPTPETHSTLPALFDPTAVSPALGGPFSSNTWGGAYMVTNFGYDATQPIGSQWLNAWGPTSQSSAASITFDISSSGATSFGVGLSNFQSLGGPIPLTNHELYINGIDQGTIESLAGANFTPGGDVRNAYLSVVATGGETITSVTFVDLASINYDGGPDWDGLNFGSLGYDTPLVSSPEPASATLMGLGIAGVLGYAWWRRKQQGFRLPNTRGFVASFCGRVKDRGEKTMRGLKLYLFWMWLVFFLALVCAGRADAGMIIASHQGASDPLNEGFSYWPYNDGISAGSLVDSGHSGWDIVSTSMTSPASNALYTSGPLTASQLAALNTQGWVMSITGRVISGPTFDSSTSLSSAYDSLEEPGIRFDIEVGLNSNGDTVVTLADNSIVNSNYTNSEPGQSYTLTGSGSSYHEYDLVYNAVSQTASLYVDGIQRITGYTGFSTGNANTGNYGFLFGSINEANTNFTLAQVETGGFLAVPEPASFSLLAVGGLVLLGFARRRRRDD